MGDCIFARREGFEKVACNFVTQGNKIATTCTEAVNKSAFTALAERENEFSYLSRL